MAWERCDQDIFSASRCSNTYVARNNRLTSWCSILPHSDFGLHFTDLDTSVCEVTKRGVYIYILTRVNLIWTKIARDQTSASRGQGWAKKSSSSLMKHPIFRINLNEPWNESNNNIPLEHSWAKMDRNSRPVIHLWPWVSPMAWHVERKEACSQEQLANFIISINLTYTEIDPIQINKKKESRQVILGCTTCFRHLHAMPYMREREREGTDHFPFHERSSRSSPQPQAHQGSEDKP